MWAQSPPARVAWIETLLMFNDVRLLWPSPPARVAWIETDNMLDGRVAISVATREGGVDRNATCTAMDCKCAVATREGGVDRNLLPT